ncbi:Spy/CpxP family protein refolding chaperone [Paraburkholderia sp.]|uniref:Spy/CpxP family protein refolding chaperone n=1 Tax=Paraburkholderia sp. TaxID=1926495 RepID=UPI0025DDF594|nr:Spy/CpxP family protein refolding chaperone [Paraburkholderia sp.]
MHAMPGRRAVACSPSIRELPTMKKTVRKTVVPALFVLAFCTTSAWAQTAATSSPDAASSVAANRAQKHADFVEQRIERLHSELKITAQQSQQWDAYAQVMRDNARSTDSAIRDRAQKLHSLNADDAMKSYASLAQLHADNMQKLATAFSTLYASLSDDQKAIADELFRNQRARSHMSHSGHKPAASSGAASAPVAASN